MPNWDYMPGHLVLTTQTRYFFECLKLIHMPLFPFSIHKKEVGIVMNEGDFESKGSSLSEECCSSAMLMGKVQLLSTQPGFPVSPKPALHINSQPYPRAAGDIGCGKCWNNRNVRGEKMSVSPRLSCQFRCQLIVQYKLTNFLLLAITGPLQMNHGD